MEIISFITNLIIALMILDHQVTAKEEIVPSDNISLPEQPHNFAIWRPPIGISWQWQLSGPIDTTFNVSMYDIDMFDNDEDIVDHLHDLGSKVICYISAGTWEDWRPDASQFPNSVIGKRLEDWEGEKWLDIRRIDIIGPIMESRMDQCKDKGFDGIETDNVDGYRADSGFKITYADQLEYNIFLAKEAHERGLSIGLKNNPDQVDDLVGYFDWALTEECFEYNTCMSFMPFIENGKAVLGVEYNLAKSDFCPQSYVWAFSSMKKTLDLGAWRDPC